MKSSRSYRFFVAASAEDSIKCFVWHPNSTNLICQQEIPAKSGPGPLAISPDEKFLYAGLRKSRQIAVFRKFSLNSTSKESAFVPLMKVDLDSDPCFLKIDPSGQWLLAAYYGAGQVTVHGISPDGDLTHNPVEKVTTGSKAHCIGTNSLNSIVWVPHVGQENAVHEFQFDNANGRLYPKGIKRAAENELVGPVGPRHCALHEPTRSIFFCNEHGSSITHYRFDDAGLKKEVNTLSTLPSPYGSANTCAQIHGDPAGRFIYVSNRGHNSLAIFAIDPAKGELKSAGWQETEPMPRAFAITPDSRYLLSSGLDSGCMTIFRICSNKGQLSFISRNFVGSHPMWVLPLRN